MVVGAGFAGLRALHTLREQGFLAFHVRVLRALPWRATRDPWAVLVSECMLQQTQVPRVVTRWQAFLDEFPSPAACAAAASSRP